MPVKKIVIYMCRPQFLLQDDLCVLVTEIIEYAMSGSAFRWLRHRHSYPLAHRRMLRAPSQISTQALRWAWAVCDAARVRRVGRGGQER